MLGDLPTTLQIEILSRLTNPVHLASVLSVCHLFRSLATTIPWKLRLDSDDDRGPGAWQRAAVSMIRSRLPLTKYLDLTRSTILDDDVTSLLVALRGLDCLILDGCQKLTSVVVDALAVCVRSGPRAVSLQRCFSVGTAAAGNLLAAASADGSRLRCILLSHLDRVDLPRGSPLVQDREEIQASKAVHSMSVGFGLRILALHNCGGLGTYELAAVAATCPLLEFLFLGGSVEALGLSRVDILSVEKVYLVASAILDLANVAKNLQVLELTFFTNTIVQVARERLTSNVQIWDLCEQQSADAAVTLLKTTSSEDVELALRAAANCSDVRRKTPLHVAAALGGTDLARSLIRIGAAVNGMKDSNGGSALFVAAESGDASVCKVLLEGGADVFAKNRAGENPIYIAALKGHCEALELMLSYCEARSWRWQDVQVYGDGWTPLMAAAVADRQDVGKVILMAAGYHSSSGSNSTSSSDTWVLKLLNAQNRHGQTALHIAARRASVWFVTNLLAAGASADLQDEFGYRAVDVAFHYGHRSVVEILKQWNPQRGVTPTLAAAAVAAAPRPSRRRRMWRAKAPV